MGLDGSTNGPMPLEVLVTHLHKASAAQPAPADHPDIGREDIMGILLSKDTDNLVVLSWGHRCIFLSPHVPFCRLLLFPLTNGSL